MARLEVVGRNVGWRMFLLLFWTVFVCCILYANSGNKAPAMSEEYMRRLAFVRQKRVTEKICRPERCSPPLLTQEDWALLERTFQNRARRSGKHVVHCSVKSLCGKGDKNFQAHCFSSTCAVYKIRMKGGNRVYKAISNEDLSVLVGKILQENSFMTIEDLGRYMEIYCQDPSVKKVEVIGDILLKPCEMMKPLPDSENVNNFKTLPKIVNILYFRFLSQWEIPFRLPATSSFLKDVSTNNLTSTVMLGKHQATKWDDDEVLSLLIQGHNGPFFYNDSLVETFHQAGYCFRIEDFSCSASRRQEAFLANITSYEKITCKAQRHIPREDILERLCADGNLTDSEMRAVLTYLLSSVHDVEESSTTSLHRPLLSISIVNTKDFKDFDVLDLVLKNFFFSITTQSRRSVLMLGGVGNTNFLRFDQNVRLHNQASNPAMMLFSLGKVSPALNEGVGQLNESLFSMEDVHYFVKTIVSNETISQSDVYTGEDAESESCGNLNVTPPFTCLCKEHFVDYENDSLMVGFAELSVNHINSQLGNTGSGQRTECALLSGVSFTKVRLGQHGDRKRFVMDLTLESELTKDKLLRRTVLDIWDTDKIPKTRVQFLNLNSPTLVPLSLQSDRLLKTLCQKGENLDFISHSGKGLLKRWSQQRHFGRKASTTSIHDDCLYLFVRDFGDCISVAMANVCYDRRYDVMLHLSLINMMSLNELPLSARLGHAQREEMAVIVKVSYTVPTFAYKLHPDFDVSYDN